jgi:hypothetical protein
VASVEGMIRMNAFTPLPNPDDATLLGGVHAEAAMIERLVATGRRSTAEMLSVLRQEFPNSPLAVRIRALEALRRIEL